MPEPRGRLPHLLQEFSIPLIVGVFAALWYANLSPDLYEYYWGGSHDHEHWLPFGQLSVFGHPITLNFLVNEIFMVFFFGIAAKEITEATLPGGSLHPLRKAVNPLLATAGGVLGPAAFFFASLGACFSLGVYDADASFAALSRGWGIPTATDIALVWLAARACFGRGHPAIDFLLLIAVVDDAIGLGIIAIFYGDPNTPANPLYLALIGIGMGLAFALRRAGVQSWVPYIFGAGPLSWAGLTLAHLHPALALVFIVPFLPGPQRDVGLFVGADEADRMGEALAEDLEVEHSPLHLFETRLKGFVDFGLFFFALANAGVVFSQLGPMTWIVLGSLVVGKTLGITLFGWLGTLAGFPLPSRMTKRDLVLSGFLAALGLTVALFLASAAFTELRLQGQAKMGALLSGLVGVLAVLGVHGGRWLRR
ncbi:MAG: Na+/H+ antiporter NhaA [Myxococcota bacterium]